MKLIKSAIAEIKKELKDNLKGHFSWKKYCQPGNHDHKFGPTKFEYICQMPIIGLVPYVLATILIVLLSCILRIFRVFGAV